VLRDWQDCITDTIMKTLTLRIGGVLDRWLTDEAKHLGRTKSEIVREAILERRNGKRPLSLHDRMKDVCGIIKGAPRDMSRNVEKYLKGFGE
jgi:predicted DNA-binding protein